MELIGHGLDAIIISLPGKQVHFRTEKDRLDRYRDALAITGARSPEEVAFRAFHGHRIVAALRVRWASMRPRARLHVLSGGLAR